MSKKRSGWQTGPHDEPRPKTPEVIPLPDRTMKQWSAEDLQRGLGDLDPEGITATATQMAAMLHNKHPGWQGAVLVDLLSHFIAGHHPATRDSILANHIETVKALVPLTEREMFNGGRHPGWKDLEGEDG